VSGKVVRLAATVALALTTASVAAGQAAPGAPASPGRPPAPAVPRSPRAPDAAAVHELSLALLQIDARDRGPAAAGRALGRTLGTIARGRRPAGRAEGVDRLAGVLVEALRGRHLAVAARDRLAVSLADVLGATGGADVELALAEVEHALSAAGVTGPGLVLIEAELRRITGARR
jgi:hypothetical protein